MERTCQRQKNRRTLAGKKSNCTPHFTSKLSVAASGRKAEVEKAIGIGGSDSQASSVLTEAMIRWRSSNKMKLAGLALKASEVDASPAITAPPLLFTGLLLRVVVHLRQVGTVEEGLARGFFLLIGPTA